ncbi:hypothetical protein CEXT_523871 [Caerostris extrusa]|uniref:Uncharacterized protein n=1 Tax=Caerostris extrusa TaxID=172846 RepID=A0AAV4XP53_CAEEX|nr:hypothetical protein CEXT_523871 [Caerostris extrusa]
MKTFCKNTQKRLEDHCVVSNNPFIRTSSIFENILPRFNSMKCIHLIIQTPGYSKKVFEGRHLPTPQNCCGYVASRICIFSMNTDEKPIRNNNNKAQPEGEFTFV